MSSDPDHGALLGAALDDLAEGLDRGEPVSSVILRARNEIATSRLQRRLRHTLEALRTSAPPGTATAFDDQNPIAAVLAVVPFQRQSQSPAFPAWLGPCVALAVYAVAALGASHDGSLETLDVSALAGHLSRRPRCSGSRGRRLLIVCHSNAPGAGRGPRRGSGLRSPLTSIDSTPPSTTFLARFLSERSLGPLPA